MMDFTLSKYKELLHTFISEGYKIYTVEEYFAKNPDDKKMLVLRHDVDEKPENALKIAKIEQNLGVKATYYFRIVSESNRPDIIDQITSMGHELGYHYENLSYCRGDYKKAIIDFEQNLAYFRRFYPVKTVCMHGNSKSPFDNKDLWNYIKLSDFELTGEPYLSFNFDEFYYIKDTGYCFDGEKYIFYDSVKSKFNVPSYHTTNDLINGIKNRELPDKILLLAHTLWTDKQFEHFKIGVREFLKNRLKYILNQNKGLKKLFFSLLNN